MAKTKNVECKCGKEVKLEKKRDTVLADGTVVTGPFKGFCENCKRIVMYDSTMEELHFEQT